MVGLRQGLLVLSLVLLASALPFSFASAWAQPAEEEEDPEYTGGISLVYEPPKNPAFNELKAAIENTQIFDETVHELNDTLSLPTDLEVTFTECGEPNAFYDPQQTRIMMCYELMAMFGQQFSAVYEDKEQVGQAILDSTVFVFHHELGHALVNILELPITGKEEDAVDDLATLVLLHHWDGGDEAALNAAESFYLAGDQQESELADIAYWDEHSLSKQRYYSIACVVYGSDPEGHKDLVGENLPEERAVRCPAEYEQKANSWDILLADYWDQGADEPGE